MLTKLNLPATLIACSILLFVSFSISAHAENANCKIKAELQDLLDLHNQTRAEARKCGSKHMPAAAKLRWNCQLSQAAEVHASDMHNGQFLRHLGSDGRSFDDRIGDAGFSWALAAENIGRGYSDSKSIHSAWLGRASHCKNIMGKGYLYMAAARSGKHWVVVFAKSH
jgi:uncharacterized protein YkwD